MSSHLIFFPDIFIKKLVFLTKQTQSMEKHYQFLQYYSSDVRYCCLAFLVSRVATIINEAAENSRNFLVSFPMNPLSNLISCAVCSVA